MRGTLLATLLALLVFVPSVSMAGAPDDPSRVSFVAGTIRETFISTANGGIENAVATAPDFATIERVRAKTRQRASAFAHGKFVDPTNPHGDLVPGLREMRRQWGKMHVAYRDLPGGGQIRYTTSDPVMVEALHQWFMARAVKKM